jgi:hypothetical protein
VARTDRRSPEPDAAVDHAAGGRASAARLRRRARPDWLCARNFAIELTAGLAEDPALARRQIAYDLWLVHEAPGGQRQSRHLELTANQGE